MRGMTDSEGGQDRSKPEEGATANVEKVKKTPVLRWRPDGGTVRELDPVLVERKLTLSVNGRTLTQINYTPGSERELIFGFLRTEGYLKNADEVLSLTMNGSDALVQMAVLREPGDPGPLPPLKWDPHVIRRHAKALLSRSELFRITGNVHSALLVRGEQVLAFGEDMGRFNAIDKCVGCALLRGEPLRDCALLTSGRLPLGMVMKAANAGIPLIVSRSAPTSAALAFAARYGLQIVGFARGEGMNIYGGS
ncbi:MAG: formate dehydrogenase accessory sulfurtransferase FdhD [Fretibacterium sp.]|nr:formate dehydrogenase accessory sulfurtransferase FdhD [Fretibacterium sp.]